MRDFNLPPRSRGELHSSESLRSDDGTDKLSRNVGKELPLLTV